MLLLPLLTACGGEEAPVVQETADNSHAVIVEGQAITDADIEAIDQVLKTFNVVDMLLDAQ